jgi:hypothetical protein
VKLPKIDQVTSEEQARDLAIEWQHSISQKSMSWGEVLEYETYFSQLADKFPNLKDEFKENAIC